MVGYGGLLAKFAFALVAETVAIGVVVGAAGEVAELVELEPVHDTVRVAVLGAWQVVGDDLEFLGYAEIDRAAGHPGGTCLPDAVDRPVGKMISVGFAMQVGGGNCGVHLEVRVGLRNESARVALHRGLDHRGIGEHETA